MAEVAATDEAPPTAAAEAEPQLATKGERKRPRDAPAEEEERAPDLVARHARVQQREEESASAPEQAGSGPESAALPPCLDDWRLVQGQTRNPYTASETAPTVLRGRVRGHPRLADGDTICSSPVVWLDWGEERAALTRSRRYVLGNPQPGFIAFIEGCTDEVSVALLSPDTTTTLRCYPNGQ